MAILRPSRPHASRRAASAVTLSLVAFGIAAALALPVRRATATPAAEMPGVDPMPAPAAGPAAAPAVRDPADRARESTALAATATCRMEGAHGEFRGTLDSHAGRVETSGWHNGDRTMQRYVGDLRLCMRLHGEVVMADDRHSVRAVGKGSWLVLESEEGELRRLVVTEGDAGLDYAFTVNGQERPWDAAARRWHDHMLRVFDLYWEASAIRGEESSLRGRISSHKGQVSSLKGRISSHKGHVSSLKGQASSYRGEVSSLRGRISSYKGHVSSLRGQISSHRGQISSLRAASRASEVGETKARLEVEIESREDAIRALEREITDYGLDARVAQVERQLADYDVDGKVAEVQQQIDQYDLDRKVAALEREIADYDLDGKVRALEREIVALDAERRAAKLERQAEPELEALRRFIGSS